MTAKRIILIALAFIAVIINADGKSIKRGVSENAIRIILLAVILIFIILLY